MKKAATTLLVVLLAGMVLAQSTQTSFDEQYKKFKSKSSIGYSSFNEKATKNYSDFRDRVNKEYADFLRTMWKVLPEKKPIPLPIEKPIPIVEFDYNDLRDTLPGINFTPINHERDEEIEDLTENEFNKHRPKIDDSPVVLPVVNIIAQPEPLPQPKPIDPIVRNEKVQNERIMPITLYGTEVMVHIPSTKFQLDGISPDDIANAWQRLATKEFDNVLYDCLIAREDLKLCDWAYLNLLQTVAQTLCGQSNAATAMLAYFYVQSGYKMRFAILDNSKLSMLIASQYKLYNHSYFEIDGENFYALEPIHGTVNICTAPFVNEQALSIIISQEQDLALNPSEKRMLTSKTGINTEMSVNLNLIEFYDNYPSGQYGDNMGSRWAVYANTPLDAVLAHDLYPILRQAIDGKSELEAANLLLNYVQTAFTYGYDNEVWGEDRAFFAEETLFYPYSDCEDRSILLSRLIRDLLGLKVVLVYYPNHLATAIHFNSDVQGDCLMVDNMRYMIADPTYIGAPVGYTMKGKDNSSAVVIRLE